VLGLPFDPHVSEAVATEPVEEAEHHNVVIKELQRGWRLKDRIARPSRVVLGEYRDSTGATPREAAPKEASAKPPGEGEPSLEDIIARTEAEDLAANPTAPSPAESLLDGLLDEEEK